VAPVAHSCIPTVRNTLTCPDLKNGLRDTVEYSESETLMVTLQGWVPDEQSPWKLLQ
jgi:hypothetical protein